MIRFSLTAMFALSILSAPPLEAQPPVTFTDATAEGQMGEFSTEGLGAVWLDGDLDGDLDIYITGQSSPDAYFRQQADGTFMSLILRDFGLFEEPTIGHRVTGGMGATAVDFDNDGDPDIFVVNKNQSSGGDEPHFAYRNKGDGTFDLVSSELGLADLNDGYGNFVWLDVNGDGRLDAYLPGRGEGTDNNNKVSYLMIAQEDGTFQNEVVGSGLEVDLHDKGPPVVLDYDDDGDLDLAVPTDDVGLILYRNNGDMTFTPVSEEAGLTTSAAVLSLGAADYDNDGDIDLYATIVFELSNILYRNNGDGTFTDVTGEAAIPGLFPIDPPNLERYWGANWVDVDNDGWLDLFLTGDTFSFVSSIQDQLYHNQGDGTFVEIGEAAGVASFREHNSSAAADYNRDGFVDFFVLKGDGNGTLYRNNGNSNHWVGFDLVGTASNRSAIGARLTMRSGTLTQTREVTANSTWGTQNSLTAHFGLGQRTRVDALFVRWPSGLLERFPVHAINKIHKLTEGTGTPAESLNAVEDFDAYE